MMQNISVLMSPRSPSGFTDIKKPNVLHHPVQAKNLNFNPYKYPIKSLYKSYDFYLDTGPEFEQTW